MFSCSRFYNDDSDDDDDNVYDDNVDDGDDECDDDDASKVPLNADLQSSTAKASSTLPVHQYAHCTSKNTQTQKYCTLQK